VPVWPETGIDPVPANAPAGDGDGDGEAPKPPVSSMGGVGRFGHRDVAVVGQARDDGGRRVRAQVRGQRGRITRVEAVAMEVIELVRIHDGTRHVCIHVGDVDFVIAGFGKQAGDTADNIKTDDIK
jgi:hypothetical protein